MAAFVGDRKDTGLIAGLAVLNALIILTNVGIISTIVDNVLSDNVHKSECSFNLIL
jgi:hypothetical protein